MHTEEFWAMTTILTILALLFCLAAAYRGWYAVWGLFYRTPMQPLDARQNRMLLIIPSTGDIVKMLETGQSAVVQYYPKSAYDIVIVAPNFSPEVQLSFSELPIRMQLLERENFSIKKAVQLALDTSSDEYNAVVLLDEGALLSPKFLERINERINDGHRAVQAQLKPKNWDSPVATLSGISDMVNAHILSKGHNALGLSAQMMGGGMAFDYALFVQTMKNIASNLPIEQGIEFFLTKEGHHIAYDEAAVVYEEKGAPRLGNQGSISKAAAYFKSFKAQWQNADCSKKHTLNLLDKFVQALFPSKFFLLLALLCGSVFSPVAGIVWAFGLALFGLGVSLAVPLVFWKNGRVLKSIFYLPAAFLKIIRFQTQIQQRVGVLQPEQK